MPFIKHHHFCNQLGPPWFLCPITNFSVIFICKSRGHFTIRNFIMRFIFLHVNIIMSNNLLKKGMQSLLSHLQWLTNCQLSSCCKIVCLQNSNVIEILWWQCFSCNIGEEIHFKCSDTKRTPEWCNRFKIFTCNGWSDNC